MKRFIPAVATTRRSLLYTIIKGLVPSHPFCCSVSHGVGASACQGAETLLWSAGPASWCWRHPPGWHVRSEMHVSSGVHRRVRTPAWECHAQLLKCLASAITGEQTLYRVCAVPRPECRSRLRRYGKVAAQIAWSVDLAKAGDRKRMQPKAEWPRSPTQHTLQNLFWGY